jgi:hypothetical protein
MGDPGGEESDFDRISARFPFNPGLRLPVAQIEGNTVLPAVRVKSSKPDAGVLGHRSLDRQIKPGPQMRGAIFLVENAAQQSAPIARSLESGIASESTTHYSRLHETRYECSLVRGQSCINSRDLLCVTRGAGETITG